MQSPLSKIFVYIFLVSSFALYSETVIWNQRFFIISQNENTDDLKSALEKSELFFKDKFNYLPGENLDIFVASTFDEYSKKTGLGFWAGGFYVNGSFIMQPVNILKKKKMFEKVVFIEYSHYFIHSITKGKCPGWFDEAVSLYYFRLFSGFTNFKVQKPLLIDSYNKLIDIKKIISNRELSLEFDKISFGFISRMSAVYGTDLIQKIFIELINGSDFENGIMKITGKKMADLYLEYFNE
jgi:hypothetical protein